MRLKENRGPVAVVLVSCLALLAGVLHFTGVLGEWRDGMSLDRACRGTLARSGLVEALDGDRVASSDLESDPGSGALTRCAVTSRDSHDSLRIDVRWGSDADDQALSLRRADMTGVLGRAAPLGGDWPGAFSLGGDVPQVSVVLACRNRKDESLFVSSLLSGSGGGPGDGGARQAAQARLTTATAMKAAEEFGCEASGGKETTDAPDDPLGAPVPLDRANGTCAALRPSAAEARKAGVPGAMESVGQKNASLTDCFLATPGGEPGYRLSAAYGPLAKAFRALTPTRLRGQAGAVEGTNHAWATARCPGSAERAVFTLWRVHDPQKNSFAVKKRSASFEAAALKAFAGQSARAQGCSDLRLP
ncbi:hypothetical protein OHS70_14195 [Streptomyces sp. NBC_00390]|uniref:hypothetical protein n=1 Tax=Streptomyces sp. NBC_00390 TaxID=2975736 RepID=UPI002E2246C3